MRDNFDRWLEFANNRYGLELKDQDLIFVCGTTKTSRWAVAAFQGPTYRKKEGHIHGDFGPLATAGLSISISNQQLPAQHWAHGPTQTLTMSPPAIDAQDQCLFLHYYKMKRRLWWKEPIKAAAGPHQLPPGPDTAGADASVAVNQYEFEPEGEPGRGEVSGASRLVFVNLIHVGLRSRQLPSGLYTPGALVSLDKVVIVH